MATGRPARRRTSAILHHGPAAATPPRRPTAGGLGGGAARRHPRIPPERRPRSSRGRQRVPLHRPARGSAAKPPAIRRFRGTAVRARPVRCRGPATRGRPPSSANCAGPPFASIPWSVAGSPPPAPGGARGALAGRGLDDVPAAGRPAAPPSCPFPSPGAESRRRCPAEPVRPPGVRRLPTPSAGRRGWKHTVSARGPPELRRPPSAAATGPPRKNAGTAETLCAIVGARRGSSGATSGCLRRGVTR